MHLLRLQVPSESHHRRGIVLIQIDGLSYPNLQTGVRKKYMPFVRRLMRKEHYELTPMYSGIPSNTPSFQGEFFFGTKQCVPAFQFCERSTKKIFTMYDKASASAIESKLAQKGEGLMTGGSAYANIFAGGASESHLCASTADIGNSLKAWNPYSIFVSFLLNPLGMIGGAFLCVIECVLGIYDLFRGVLNGEDLLEEFKFIFMRLFVSIVMREIITSHAYMDIYRGLPVIQVNYFGYDEQAHRRGPATRFALWSLGGIDKSIKKLWYAASKAKRRHYDVWIYSDHGQNKVEFFTKKNGKSIQKAIQELYESLYKEKLFTGAKISEGLLQPGSVGDNVSSLKIPKKKIEFNPKEFEDRPIVTTLGPIAQIYFPVPLTDEEKKVFLIRLMKENPALPLGVIPLESGRQEYYSQKGGPYELPRDSEIILGEDHPYRAQVTQDLESLFKNEYRGDLLFFGWANGAEAISFSNENGAHAGLSPDETQAFALLPPDAPLPEKQETWIRGEELREGVLVYMRKLKGEKKTSHKEETRSFRLLTYNVHSCVGSDGILSTERIARVIAKSNADIVALQELDGGRKIKGAAQAADIARDLEMNFHFHSVMGAELQCFGNAILSRYPMRLIRAEHLPTLKRPSSFLEPRGVLWVEIDISGKVLHVLNTHMSLWGPELEIQIKQLLGEDFLGSPELGKDVIVCGDFNTTPSSKYHRMILQHFRELTCSSENKINQKTWPSRWPMRKLDHIFMKGDLQGEMAPLQRTYLECSSSDHFPIAADFRLIS